MDRTNVIGEKIKGLRMAKEISLDELADRTGLAIEQITRIEENIDIPSLAPLVKLARALGVTSGNLPRRPARRSRSGSMPARRS